MPRRSNSSRTHVAVAMTHLPGMERAGRLSPATDRGPPGAVAGGGGEPRVVPAGVGRMWSAAVRGSPPDAPSAPLSVSTRRPPRESNAEAAAPVRLAVHLDRPAEGRRDPGRDRQPEPGPGDAGLMGQVRP